MVVDGVRRGTFTPGRNPTYDTYSTTLFNLSPGNHTLTVRGTVASDVTAFVDAIELQLDAGIVSYLHSDPLGSASLTTDGMTGALVTAMHYLPFGETQLSGRQPADRQALHGPTADQLQDYSHPRVFAADGGRVRRVDMSGTVILAP